MAHDNSCSRHHHSLVVSNAGRRESEIQLEKKTGEKTAQPLMVLGAKCVWISYEGCKSFSSYNPAGESPPHVRLSLSLSFLWRDESRVLTGVEAPWSIQTHCGVSSMEIWKGSKGETTDERMKARSMVRGYGRKTAHARCAHLEGFSYAFPRSFAFSFPKRVSIISLWAATSSLSLLGNHLTKWDPCALMRHFFVWVSWNMLRAILSELTVQDLLGL